VKNLIKFHNRVYKTELEFEKVLILKSILSLNISKYSQFDSYIFEEVWGGSKEECGVKVNNYHESDEFNNCTIVEVT
jgi:hypothetical protein